MRLLDLFCKAGGASAGYYRAGFTDITGVDIEPQPRYPYNFVQDDALNYLAAHGHEYDLIHASPPCQGYSRMRHLPWLQGRQYDLLIEPVRDLLVQIGKPYVIENVSDSPLNGAVLCGAALGLPIIRHRRFECNPFVLFPPCPGHPTLMPGKKNMRERGRGRGVMGVPMGVDPREYLGIDWMTKFELRQAVPPAYTEFIGRRIMETIYA